MGNAETGHRVVTADGQEHTWPNQTISAKEARDLLDWGPEVPLVVEDEKGELQEVADDGTIDLRRPCKLRPHWCYRFEGKAYDWPRPIITGAELRERHNVDGGVPLIQEDESGKEHEIADDDRVHLGRPCRFGISADFRRGLAPRWEEEVELLRQRFPEIQADERGWVEIPSYPLPAGLFNREHTTIGFLIPPPYPQQAPDNFYVEPGLTRTDGGVLGNYSEGKDPFGRRSGVFSWHPKRWRPASSPQEGDSLLSFMRSVRARLEEGS